MENPKLDYRKKYEPIARAYAQKHGINPDLFVAQINQESGFNPSAKSKAGAIGIAQIVPKWHPGVNASDPNSALLYAANLMGGYYKTYKNQGLGDEMAYKLALAHYNGGSGGAKYLQRNPQYFNNPDIKAPGSSWKNQSANYAKKIWEASNYPQNQDPISQAAQAASQDVINFSSLVDIAKKYGVKVTSTNGGSHNKGSKHYQGLAIDIDHNTYQKLNPEQRKLFDSEVMQLGGVIHDETTRPKNQKVWGGPHYHIELSGIPKNSAVNLDQPENNHENEVKPDVQSQVIAKLMEPQISKKDLLDLSMYFHENRLNQDKKINSLKEQNLQTSMQSLALQRQQQQQEAQLQRERLLEQRKMLEAQKRQEIESRKAGSLAMLNKIGGGSPGSYTLPQMSGFSMPKIELSMPDFGGKSLFGNSPL